MSAKRTLKTTKKLSKKKVPKWSRQNIGVVKNELFNAILETAALKSTFSIDDVADPKIISLKSKNFESVQSEAINNLFELCEYIPAKKGKKSRWRLDLNERRQALQGMKEKGVLKDRIERVQKGSKANLEEKTLYSLLEDKNLSIENQNAEELWATKIALKWIGEEELNNSRYKETNARLRSAELLEPLRSLITNFKGRKKELELLRIYVNALPGEKSFGDMVNRFREFFDLHEKPPLLIHGIGGIGKSTLIAKFLLQHVDQTSNKELIYSFIDFDHSSVSIKEPLTLMIECISQLTTQFLGSIEQLDKIRDQWTRILSQTKRTSYNKNDPTNLAVLGWDEISYILDDIRKFWEDNDLYEIPYLLVLDSFEEVQRLGDTVLKSFFDFLSQLSERIPRLRTVLVSRSEITAFKTETLFLKEFDHDAAIGFLNSHGIKEQKLTSLIFEKLGGNPLTLELAIEVLKKENLSAYSLKDIHTRNLWLVRVDEERIQQELFKRNLNHIKHPLARKLAYPGLVLRRITPDIIQKVMAKPCLGKNIKKKGS